MPLWPLSVSSKDTPRHVPKALEAIAYIVAKKLAQRFTPHAIVIETELRASFQRLFRADKDRRRKGRKGGKRRSLHKSGISDEDLTGEDSEAEEDEDAGSTNTPSVRRRDRRSSSDDDDDDYRPTTTGASSSAAHFSYGRSAGGSRQSGTWKKPGTGSGQSRQQRHESGNQDRQLPTELVPLPINYCMGVSFHAQPEIVAENPPDMENPDDGTIGWDGTVQPDGDQPDDIRPEDSVSQVGEPSNTSHFNDEQPPCPLPAAPEHDEDGCTSDTDTDTHDTDPNMEDDNSNPACFQDDPRCRDRRSRNRSSSTAASADADRVPSNSTSHVKDNPITGGSGDTPMKVGGEGAFNEAYEAAAAE